MDALIQSAFADASAKIARDLGPEVNQAILKFAHTIEIDSRTQFQLYPSNLEHHPLGLMIQSFDRTGGLDSEVAVGFFAEWSFALACIKGVLAIHNEPAETATEHLVMHNDVQIGDLIADLGFTVTSLDRFTDHVRLYDGDGQMLLLLQGREFKVTRNWEGYSSFMAEQQVVTNG